MIVFHAKKGMSLPLEALIGLVLAVIAMITIVYVGARLSALFIPSSLDPATESNFNNLAKAIISLGEGKKEKDAIRYFPFHISSQYILMGFPKDVASIADECYSHFPIRHLSVLPSFRGVEHIQRPIVHCGRDACLCLYRNRIGFDDVEKEQPLKCILLPNIDSIYSPYYQDEEMRQPHSHIPSEIPATLVGASLPEQPRAYGGWTGRYQYFFIYGKCFSNQIFGVQKLYLDMHHDEAQKVHIFIAGESGNTQDRWNDLQLGLSGFPTSLKKQLEELVLLVKTSKDIFAQRNAVVTVLSSPMLVDQFLARSTPEEFRKTFFEQYKKPSVSLPSLTEEKIKDNAARVWEDFSLPLMKIGIPYQGKDHYIQTCLVAFKTAREENDCWLPKWRDINH